MNTQKLKFKFTMCLLAAIILFIAMIQTGCGFNAAAAKQQFIDEFNTQFVVLHNISYTTAMLDVQMYSYDYGIFYYSGFIEPRDIANMGDVYIGHYLLTITYEDGYIEMYDFYIDPLVPLYDVGSDF